jgi:hypothetical protein
MLSYHLSQKFKLIRMSNAISFLKVILNVMWLLKSSIDQILINHISNSMVILKVTSYLGGLYPISVV